MIRKSLLPLLLLGALAGCEQQTGADQQAGADQTAMPGAEGQQAQDMPEDAQKAILIAFAVDPNPQQMETVLRSNAISPDEFDQLMYDVATDPEATRAYLQARQVPPGGGGQQPPGNPQHRTGPPPGGM